MGDCRPPAPAAELAGPRNPPKNQVHPIANCRRRSTTARHDRHDGAARTCAAGASSWKSPLLLAVSDSSPPAFWSQETGVFCKVPNLPARLRKVPPASSVSKGLRRGEVGTWGSGEGDGGLASAGLMGWLTPSSQNPRASGLRGAASTVIASAATRKTPRRGIAPDLRVPCCCTLVCCSLGAGLIASPRARSAGLGATAVASEGHQHRTSPLADRSWELGLLVWTE